MAARGPSPGYPANALGWMKPFAKEISVCDDGDYAEQLLLLGKYLPLILEALDGECRYDINSMPRKDSTTSGESLPSGGLSLCSIEDRFEVSQDSVSFAAPTTATHSQRDSAEEEPGLQQQRSTPSVAGKAKQLKFDSANRFSGLSLAENDNSYGKVTPNFTGNNVSLDDADALYSQHAWEDGEDVPAAMKKGHTDAPSTSVLAQLHEAKKLETKIFNGGHEAKPNSSTKTGTNKNTKTPEQRKNEMQQLIAAKKQSKQANAPSRQWRQNVATSTQSGDWNFTPVRLRCPPNSQDVDPCKHLGFWDRINERLTCNVCSKVQSTFVYRCPSCSKHACADCRRIISQS